MLHSDERPIEVLLGSGCSQASAATAELAHIYNITQASFTMTEST